MENITIKEKGLEGYLNEDKSLVEKRTFEEMSRIKTGVDDSGIEKAYEEFCAVQKRTGIEPKGLEGYLEDDEALLEERTFDEVNKTKDEVDNSKILKTEIIEFLDSKIVDFFPDTGLWKSNCFRKEQTISESNLPCHLRDSKWLAELIMKKYDLYSLGAGIVEEYVRNSEYFNKMRHDYEQRIVKWQINWMLKGGEGWIVDSKYGSEDFLDFSTMCDYGFRKGIVDTLLVIGMDIEAIEEGIESNIDMWRDSYMNLAFNNQFTPNRFRITSNESLKEAEPLFKENWLKYRKWQYYQEHKESVEKYGIVTEEMKITEDEVTTLEKYLNGQALQRFNEIEEYNNRKRVQEESKIKEMIQSDFYSLSYEDCLPQNKDNGEKPRGLKKLFKNFISRS